MFQRILVGLEGSPLGRLALQAALELACRDRARLIALSVIEEPVTGNHEHEETESLNYYRQVQANAVAQANAAGITLQMAIHRGHATRATISALVELLRDREDFRAQYQQSFGLCLPHFKTFLEEAKTEEDVLAFIIGVQIEQLTALSSEVGEYLRKHDSRFAEETVHDCAAEQLERLGDWRAIVPLLQALRRQPLPRAAHALASFHVDTAIPLIVHCLEDDFIRDRMASTLLAFGLQVLDPLIETLERRTCLGGEEAPASIGRRVAAARMLGELGDAQAVNALRPLLHEQALEVRIEAAVALTHLAKEEGFADAVSELIADLDTESLRLKWRAEEGLCNAGPAAVCLMVQVLEDTLMDENNSGIGHLSHDTLVRIIRLLGHCPSPSVIGVLRSVAIDSDVELRSEAIRALGRLREPEGILLLIYMLEKDDNPSMRAIAAEALGMFTREAVVESLVRALENRHPRVRRAAARALSRLGSVAKPCLQQAIKQHRWALSLDHQRLVWGARRVLRHLRDGKQA